MTDRPYLSPVVLEKRRERVIDALTEHYAHDHLDEAELERRFDQAYQATALAQLDALTADLPALPTPATRDAKTPGRPMHGLAMAHPGEVRERQFVLAIMGGTERRGVWTPAHNIEAVALMGGVELDFREARFAPGVTQINALAIMGSVEILVPPGVRVESSGIGIMGGFEGIDQTGPPDWEEQPILRISGLALMGAVEVMERLPGESKRDAQRRRREERRRLRRGE